MSTRQRATRALALVTIAGLAACSDSVAPGNTKVPAAAVTAAANDLSAVTTDATLSALLNSIGGFALAPNGSAAARLGAATSMGVRGLRSAQAGSRLTTNPFRAYAAPRLTTANNYAIPSTMRGKVYVHDVNDQYVADANGSGAPANGFRIMLYPYTATTQAWGTTPIGYADVTDEGSGSVQRIVVQMFATGAATPVFSFGIASAGTASGSADTLSGTVHGANGKSMTYEFDGLTTGVGTASGERTVTKLHIALPASNFEVNGLLIDGLQAGDTQSLSMKVGSDEVALSVATVETQGLYVESDTTHINLNGRLIGYAIGYLDAPDKLVHTNGSEFSLEEKAALVRLLGATVGALGLVGVTTFFAVWAITLGFQTTA